MTTELEAARHRLEAAAAEAKQVLRDHIKELTLEGKTNAEIIDRLGCSQFQIHRTRRDLGIESRTASKPKINPDALAEQIAAGKTREQIADHFGCAIATVTAARRAAGLPMAARKPRTRRIDPQQVKSRSEAGQPLAVIAEALGCSVSSVIKVRHDLGISDHTKAKLDDETKRRIEAMLDDDCSFAEITRTLGITWETLKRHYDGRQWTREQQNEHLRTVRMESGYNWARQAAA